jgi:hypothetical protein
MTHIKMSFCDVYIWYKTFTNGNTCVNCGRLICKWKIPEMVLNILYKHTTFFTWWVVFVHEECPILGVNLLPCVTVLTS